MANSKAQIPQERTMNPLGVVDLRTVARKAQRERWGRWRLVRPGVIAIDKIGYEVECREMTTAEVCLDWVFQVCRKRWMTADDKSNLLEAIQDLVDPQAKLCPFGIAKGRQR